jgi:hypothetical protein
MRVTGNKELYLDFLRELVIGLFTNHGKHPTLRKRPSLSVSTTRLEELL